MDGILQVSDFDCADVQGGRQRLTVSRPIASDRGLGERDSAKNYFSANFDKGGTQWARGLNRMC